MATKLDYTEALHSYHGIFRRFPLKLVHGIPLMEPIAEQWAPVENFQARPDDLVISTYPKAGTTWMQEIVDLVLAGGDVEKAKRAPVYVRIPFLEICSPGSIPSGVDLLVNAPSPRVIKTHLPYQLVPKSFWEKNCKMIYVARNAKDNLVSYYFFDQMNLTQPDPGPWEDYIKRFMEGKVPWGSWYDHVRRYWEEKENHRLLYLFYEDMKEETVVLMLDREFPNGITKLKQVFGGSCNAKTGGFQSGVQEGNKNRFRIDLCGLGQKPPDGVLGNCSFDLQHGILKHAKIKDLAREVRRVRDFLEVDLPEDVVQKIVHHTTFTVMKDNPMANYETIPSLIFDKSKGTFMRKGDVGDWKNYFTVAQQEEFDADYWRKMEGTTLHFRDEL